jgi:nucleoside-diphosphate-sugar epimerase
MRVLVMGATGFSGRALTRRLVELGHEVAGLARSPAAEAALARAGLGCVDGDVLQPQALVPALRGFDAIVYMPRIDLPSELASVGALLDALEGTGKRFVFTSGTGVLTVETGGDWHPVSFAEDDAFVPSEVAGLRCRTEALVRAAAGRGVHAMVVRPPMIWGHGFQRALSALHGSARSGAVRFVGRGLNAMSSIHVDDLAEIFALALERGVAGALYHAVSGEVTWRGLAAEVARLRGLPARSVGFAEAQELFGPVIARIVFSGCQRTQCPRTRDELGWAPHPDRLDLYAELAHPAFMADAKPNSDLDGYFPAHAGGR